MLIYVIVFKYIFHNHVQYSTQHQQLSSKMLCSFRFSFPNVLSVICPADP